MSSRPMRRWQVGHHAFFVLLQGLILAQRQLLSALQAKDISGARKLLQRISTMLEAAAIAMQLAADMSSQEYEEIRLSMQPPHVPEGFSGLWSPDHKLLLTELRQLKLILSSPEAKQLNQEIEDWQRALDKVYSAHVLVCERFVGDAPSLAAMRAGTEKKPLDTLEALRQRSLSLLNTENA